MTQSVADQFKLWRNRVDSALKCIDEEKPDWDKYVDAYEGKILDRKKSDFKGHLTQTNLFYVDVRSTTPKLYSQNPYIRILPETPEADLNAEIMEKVVNNKLEDWKLKPRSRDLIKGAKLKGRAYIKVTYKFDKDKVGRSFEGDEPNDEVILSYVDRENLALAKGATSFYASRFVSHKIYAPIDEIREKFKIKKDEKITVVDDCDLDGIPAEDREDFQFGTYHEIENRVDHTLAIVVDGLNRWGVKPYKHPYDFYTMYVPLEWNNIPGRVDTKADLHFWYRLLVELCETRTQQINHRRKLNSKYQFTGPKKPTPEQVKRLTSYEDGEWVWFKPGESASPFAHAPLGPEVTYSEQSLMRDITILSGMHEMKQGASQSPKTAREATMIYLEAKDVISDRAGLVEEALGEVIKKAMWMVQKFYDSTRIISLTGMEEAEFLGFKEKANKNGKEMIKGTSKRPYLFFVGTQLTGKMRVKVKAGSTLPENEEQRRTDMEQLFGLLGKFPQVAAGIDPKELLKEVSKLLHMENKGVILDPKSPEQENSLLKRNIPIVPHLNEPHDQHIAIHDMENNRTPAFIAHQLTHKLMKSWIEKSQLTGTPPAIGGNGLGRMGLDNISGYPMGAQVPPGAGQVPPQGSPAAGVSPAPQTSPTSGGVPPGVQ